MLFFYSIRGCELIKERDWDTFGDLLCCSSFWEEEGSQGLSLNLATEEMILQVIVHMLKTARLLCPVKCNEDWVSCLVFICHSDLQLSSDCNAAIFSGWRMLTDCCPM